uniref:Uncharacterized protein n=1 Tax=Quercus lobata TaxID=97700 RepID=A0A7N2N0C6_QUELO
MEKNVEIWDEYMKTYSRQHYRRSCVSAIQIWYSEQLCKDKGWNPKRKKGFIAELLEPYGPLDYILLAVLGFLLKPTDKRPEKGR